MQVLPHDYGGRRDLVAVWVRQLFLGYSELNYLAPPSPSRRLAAIVLRSTYVYTVRTVPHAPPIPATLLPRVSSTFSRIATRCCT